MALNKCGTLVGIVAGVMVVGLLAGAGSGDDKPAAGKATLRVGTYDNRAVAIAYASSQYNAEYISRLQVRQAAARKAGDKEAMARVEEEARKHQHNLKLQGFCRVPVTDLLAHVQHLLPEIAREAKVDLIAWECDWQSARVEKVDLSEELFKAFAPKERAYKWLKQIKGKPYVATEKVK